MTGPPIAGEDYYARRLTYLELASHLEQLAASIRRFPATRRAALLREGGRRLTRMDMHSRTRSRGAARLEFMLDELMWVARRMRDERVNEGWARDQMRRIVTAYEVRPRKAAA